MAHLALALLGPFQATLNGQPAQGLVSDWRRALLAYLAVERGREHPREQLASLLWPERSDQEALSALRYALSNLRSALGDRRSAGDRRSPGDRRPTSPVLLLTRSSAQFNPDSDHWLDVAEFQELSRRSNVADLERAASLYRGPFLHGLSLRDSPAFDEWMLLKGEETRRSMLSALGRLTSLQMARGDYAEAARWARRQLELEPYREQAHRQLIAALDLGGERSAALAQYEACRRMLMEELGCEPEDETRALCAQIRAGRLSAPGSRPPSFPAIPITASPAAPSSRFVAREQQLSHLDTLLEQALAGQGAVAIIVGEAGGGKTALLEEFARRAGQAHPDLIALRGSCNAHAGVGDPYLPFREILQALAGDIEGEQAGGTLSPEQVRRVWQALPVVSAALVEHGPDLIDSFVRGEALLRRIEGFPFQPGPTHWHTRLREIVNRARERAATAAGPNLAAPPPQCDLFAQVTRVLHAVSLSTPLVLAIDDLQWTDGGTAALLFHLGRRLAGSRILLACACRPAGLVAGERGQPVASGLEAILQELCRRWGDVIIDLDQADGRAFVEAYIDSEPNRLEAAFRQRLYDHTGGNPLFTIELLRSFEREGALVQDKAGRWFEAPGLDWSSCPPQVEAVIAGHLADLPDEDGVLLRAASVQGEQFAAEVVAQVLGWDEEAVVWRLSGPLRTRHRLVEPVSLDRLTSSGRRLSRYRFRHALVQGSAYRSLDAVARARLHEATGQAVEAIGATMEQSQVLAPDLARHYEVAGLPLEAARCRLAAGQWAARLMAYDEAIAHLERGLALLEGAPASPERLRLELALCLALIAPAMLRQGWRAPASTRALERLSDLTQHPNLQSDPQRFTAMTVLAQATSWSADPERGRRLGEQLLDLAQDGDRQSLMLAHWVLGLSHWLSGQLVAALARLGQVLDLYDPEAGHPLSPVMGADPGVTVRAVRGLTLWLLGYPDRGRDSLQEALAQAREIEQPSSSAFAHLWAGATYALLGRDEATALMHSEALRSLGETGVIYGVWAELLAGQGSAAGPEPRLKQGSAQTAEAASAMQALSSGVGYASLLLVQAHVYARAGQAEMGLAAVDQALAWVERTGVRVMEAEVWRMRGELLLLAANRPWTMDEGSPRRLWPVVRRRPGRWRHASTMRSRLRAARRRVGWSYGRSSAWRGCGGRRAAATRRASY